MTGFPQIFSHRFMKSKNNLRMLKHLHRLPRALPRRAARLGLVCSGLLLGSCATRDAKYQLGSEWPATEPVVKLDSYESVQRRPGQRSDVAVAVAISGGGMRAGNFASGVLKALESVEVRGAAGTRSNLLREVDYFSTVSGGGMAAGSYMTHLLDYLQKHPEDKTGAGFSFARAEEGNGSKPGWRVSLARNYQASLVGSFVNPLMLATLDRGDILENRLDQHVLGRPDGRSLRMRDVFVPRGGGLPRVPYWVTNATVYENGAIFPFTPDIMAQYSVSGYKHQLRRHVLDDPYDMPLAVGLKASASFPAAIPPSTLQSTRDARHPYIHLSDGGLADNLGIITALRLLHQDKAPVKILIVIDAYNGRTEPFSKTTNPPGLVLSVLRTTSISLDSAHQHVRALLNVSTAQTGVDFAIIDFDQVLRDEATQKDTPATQNSIAQRDGGMSPQSIQGLFTQALGVGTWFRISRDAQDILLRAGENAIYRHQSSGERELRPGLQALREKF